MATVLVTGAAGFIGSNLSRTLIERGYRVVGVDNMDESVYDRRFKEEHLISLKNNENFVFYEEDVCNKDSLKSIFATEKPDYIIHLAARAETRKSVDEPYEYLDVNVVGTLNLLELAKDFKIKNFVFASSSSVYGNDATTPFKENDSEAKPISPYGATKKTGELLVYTYHHNFELPTVCLRFFNVYGENNRPGMVPYIWAERLLKGQDIYISGDGTRKRDYTYIDDIVEGIILAVEKEDIGFDVINLGSGNPFDLNELVSVFEEVLDIKADVKSRPSKHASVEETYADISKAKEVLGWEPHTSLKEGITNLVDWFRVNRLKDLE